MNILVTGAAGSIGQAVVARLRELGHHPIVTDIAYPRGGGQLDVTDAYEVWHRRGVMDAHVICHFAAAKHAPEGELDPGHVARVNLDGTRNILLSTDGRVILASTCKAADPETAYGASKLIAERLVLNAGGTVLRYFNVPESSGNVFRLWESLPPDAPIPWTDCWRYFVSIEQAAWLAVRALDLPPGRYALDPGEPRHMRDVAAWLYPDRELVEVPRRRGDRYREPLCAACETVERIEDGILAIRSPHDAVTYAEAIA